MSCKRATETTYRNKKSPNEIIKIIVAMFCVSNAWVCIYLRYAVNCGATAFAAATLNAVADCVTVDVCVQVAI